MWKFENVKIWKFSKNLKIWKFSKNLKIFLKSENFPKIWNFSKNLIFFENLKMFRKSNLHTHLSDWCTCALYGDKKCDQPTKKAFLGIEFNISNYPTWISQCHQTFQNPNSQYPMFNIQYLQLSNLDYPVPRKLQTSQIIRQYHSILFNIIQYLLYSKIQNFDSKYPISLIISNRPPSIIWDGNETFHFLTEKSWTFFFLFSGTFFRIQNSCCCSARQKNLDLCCS